MLPSAYGRNRSATTIRFSSERAPQESLPPAPLGQLRPQLRPQQRLKSRPRRGIRIRAYRFLLPVLACIVVLLAGVLLIGTGIAGARSNHAETKPVHTVAAGETLWSIARSVKPQGDVRPLVAKIARLNHVGHTLEPGATLLLP